MDTLFDSLSRNPWAFLIMKMLMLALLYLFIFRVVVMVTRDVKKRTAEEVHDDSPTHEGVAFGASYGLVVIESNVKGIKTGANYPLRKTVTIGRGAKNSIEVNDSFVSHEHARVFSRNGEFFIEDMSSKNGTLLDGNRITGIIALNEGDILQVGGVTFKMVRWENESS